MVHPSTTYSSKVFINIQGGTVVLDFLHFYPVILVIFTNSHWLPQILSNPHWESALTVLTPRHPQPAS